MLGVSIHQIQLRYDADADRLLLQVRDAQAQVYASWLTRRMMAQLHGPLRDTLARQAMALSSPTALPVPEARQMLEEVALQRPLPGTQFDQPFASDGASHPLGAEPLLPGVVQFTPLAQGGLSLALQEAAGRRLELVLAADLATALLRLLDAALRAAEWDLPASPRTTHESLASMTSGGVPPGRLN